MKPAWESAARAACGLESGYGSASYWLSCSRILWVMYKHNPADGTQRLRLDPWSGFTARGIRPRLIAANRKPGR